MRVLTDNEIGRTAFKEIKGEWNSPFGYLATGKDKNEMCPYCKSEHTNVVRDHAYLMPFEIFYGSMVDKFTVVNCSCCSAVFSFYVPHEARSE